VCEKECIPGEASLSLSLPVAGAGAAAAPTATATASFDAARRALPQPSPWGARMQLAPDRVTLQVDAKGLTPGAIRSAFFFPYAETLVRHAAPQQLDVTRDGLVLRLERSALSTAAPKDAGGVLVLEETLGATNAAHAFQLANVAIGQGAAPYEPASLTAVLQAAFLALVGGVILNLMPCVFPVLSIKVLALVEQAGFLELLRDFRNQLTTESADVGERGKHPNWRRAEREQPHELDTVAGRAAREEVLRELFAARAGGRIDLPYLLDQELQCHVDEVAIEPPAAHADRQHDGRGLADQAACQRRHGPQRALGQRQHVDAAALPKRAQLAGHAVATPSHDEM